MNKRGVAWPQILEMILVLIVIATVTYIAFPNIFRDTKQLLNETATTVPSSKDFVPYVPDENMPQDLKITHNSVLALKFALESVAKGVQANANSNIGYTCSKDKDNEKLTCTVKNFELPQAKDELGTDGWKGWIAEGIGDPKYVLFYEQLPQGVEKSWAVDKYRLSNKWLIASGVMNAIPGAWAARHFITGGLPKHLLAESIKTASEKIGKETTEQALKESAERGEKGVSKWMSSRQAKKAGKKASKEFANDVKKDLMPNSVAQFLKNLGENNAKLSAEEIARKELTRDFLFRHFGREALEDIPYDDISESFIKNIGKRLTKEEAAKEVDGFFSTKVDDAGSTLAEKLSKNILPDDISQAGAVMQRKHAVELDFLKLKYSVGSTPEDFAKADWFVAEASVLKKKFGYLTDAELMKPPLSQIKSLDDIADENIKAELRKETEELAEKLSKDRAEGKIDDTLSMIARDNIVNLEMSKVKRNLVTESQILSRLSQRQLKTLMSYKQMFTSFVENAPDGTLRINREFLSDTLEEAAKNAYPKNSQLQEMLLKNFDDVSPMIFNSRGRFMETVILDNVGEDAAEALEKDFLEASMETVKQSVNLKNIMKAIWINAFGKAEGETGWEKFISWARNQVPYSREAAERFGGGGILGAIGRTGAGYGVGYAVGGEEGAEAGALAASMPGVTVGSVKWLFQHRYATAALIWWQASKIEAMNEKYEAQGINTLAVSTPYVIDNSKLFQLNDVTNDYYIALLLDDKWYLPGDNPDIERFFMASPCKAELVITKAACACEVMTDDDVMKITTKGLGGEIPLIKGTAQSDESLMSGPGDTYIRYLTKANSDLSHAVKTCNYNPSIDTNDFFDEIYQGIDWAKSGVTGIFTDNDNVGTVTAPCLKVKATLDDDYKKANGANFCYPSSDPTDEVASAAIMIGFGIVDAGVTVAGAALAPETLGLSLIAVPIVHFTTGVLSDISLSAVAHKWPDRG